MDSYGIGGGLIVQYDYVASNDGKFSLAISPVSWDPVTTNSPNFHVSAFANVKTGDSAPALNVDCVMNLGEILPGNNNSLPLEIANTGGGTVSGSIAGEAAPFSLATNIYSTVAGNPDSVNVTFAPTVEGSFSNVITLSGIGGSAQVMLTGEAVPEPCLFIIYNLLFIIYYLKNKA